MLHVGCLHDEAPVSPPSSDLSCDGPPLCVKERFHGRSGVPAVDSPTTGLHIVREDSAKSLKH